MNRIWEDYRLTREYSEWFTFPLLCLFRAPETEIHTDTDTETYVYYFNIYVSKPEGHIAMISKYKQQGNKFRFFFLSYHAEDAKDTKPALGFDIQHAALWKCQLWFSHNL